MSSNASPSKRKPTKKKQITTKSSSIRSDKRATTNRCGNYIPTPISSILDKLSQPHKKVKEICYFCQYSLFNNCFFLHRKSRRNNIECLARWLDETPQLPDIDLINNFNYELLLQYANSTSDSGFSSGNENNNSIQIAKKENEIANNLQIKELFGKHLSEIENNIFIRNKKIVDDNVNISDIQDKQYFDVEQEDDKDPKTKTTLEYFGLSCVEDMFTGSEDESDSTIIYSPNYPINKVKSIYVISDDESDLEANTNTCNDGKSLRKRHINESDSESPVCKSKKSGNQQMRDCDSENRKFPREHINESDSEGPMFKSAYTPIVNNVIDSSSTKNSVNINTKESGIIFESSIAVSDNNINLSNNTDMSTNSKLLKKQNIEFFNEVQEIETASMENTANIASFTINNIPFDDNDNDVLVIERNISCTVISDTESDSETNTDIDTDSKLQRERSNDSNNECLDNESVDKKINTIIANFTSKETITLPFDDNDNDVQVIETNVPCIVISDTVSDSENNTDINTNSKLQRERNNYSNNECLDVEPVKKGMNTNIASFTSNETITLPFDDNDIQIIETNVPCIIISDTYSENNTNMNPNGQLKLLRDRNNEANPEADNVSASNKVIATCVIIDSDSDDDGWLDQYLRY